MTTAPQKSRAIRVQLKVPGAATTKSSFHAEISGVSETGLSFKTTRRLELGKEITVAFTLEDDDKSKPIVVEVTGEIRHAGDKGYGLRFLRLTQESRDAIRMYVTRHQSDEPA